MNRLDWGLRCILLITMKIDFEINNKFNNKEKMVHHWGRR